MTGGEIENVVVTNHIVLPFVYFDGKICSRKQWVELFVFLPGRVLEEAQKRGIADKEDTMKKGKRFMVPFCVIEGMEDVPYTKPWWYMIKRRILASIMYLAVAVIVAAIVVLIGKL